MRLKTYRHLWGATSPLEEAFRRFEQAGYHGVEVAALFMDDLQKLHRLCQDHQFEVICQVITPARASSPTPQAHLQTLKEQIEAAKRLDPILYNVQGGLDCWTEAEQDHFYAEALRYAETLDVPLTFETPRGQPTFTPCTTARILRTFPELRLTADFSHWVNVCERLLEDQEPHLRLAASRTLHVHARVGHEEGPQVNDPAAPEWSPHLQQHEKWWRWVWEAQKDQGLEVSTLTPEFGPPNYQPTLPFSQEPVGDLETICNWMKTRQERHFQEVQQQISPAAYR